MLKRVCMKQVWKEIFDGLKDLSLFRYFVVFVVFSLFLLIKVVLSIA